LFGDLPRGRPNLKPILEDPLRQPVVHVESVGRDEFDGVCRALVFQDRSRQQTHDFCIKIETSTFNRDLDIEEFFDWVAKCDRVKEYSGFLENNMVKLVVYNLKGRSSWCKHQTNTRLREGRHPITLWMYMRQLLHERFIPPNYEQIYFSNTRIVHRIINLSLVYY
jgi:hypothetical protein